MSLKVNTLCNAASPSTKAKVQSERDAGVKVVPAYSRLVWGQSAVKARQHLEAEFHISETAGAFFPAKSVCRMLVLPEWSRFGDDCRRPSRVLG